MFGPVRIQSESIKTHSEKSIFLNIGVSVLVTQAFNFFVLASRIPTEGKVSFAALHERCKIQ